MKIGILTLPLHTNFGGILQAWALQTVLERMGHEVEIIDKERDRHLRLYDKVRIYPKRLLKKYVLNREIVLDAEKKHNEEYPIIAQNIIPFVDKHLHRREVYNLLDLKENDFDAYIVGSDQILRPIYARNIYQGMKNVFLSFTKKWDVKRIFYAASFGTDKWEYRVAEEIECRVLLKQFNAISSRETSGVDLFRNKLNAQATLVLDPTLLLDLEDYLSIARIENNAKPTGKVLHYVLDKNAEIDKIIADISKTRNLVPFKANSDYEMNGASLKDKIQISIEDWLSAFNEADIIITDSFHACVFSMIFNKPFVVIGNVNRGMSRFSTLLKLSKQEFRLVSTYQDYKDKEDRIVEFPNVDLSQMKESSVKFLANALLD